MVDSKKIAKTNCWLLITWNVAAVVFVEVFDGLGRDEVGGRVELRQPHEIDAGVVVGKPRAALGNEERAIHTKH
jgi:hypothetical protein